MVEIKQVLNKLTRSCHLTRVRFTLFIVIVAALTFVNSSFVSASPVVGFNAGHIIDDTVFTNYSSMSVSQIQAFLNSKVPTCDTWHAPGYGENPPFICLKDYSENGKSAAQIIYEVSQQFRINPQVFIVLLQKEQGLVTDTWPLTSQYRTAAGYGCPDTSACDSQYYGLTNQLTWAGTMYRTIMNGGGAWSNQYRSGTIWYTPYVLGNNFIKWHPDFDSGRRDTEGNVIWEDRCGGTTVNIENRSTQALYNYTPYQPNQASLDAGYGTGDMCSSHGNRNFYQYFKDWFGSTIGPDYAWSIESFSYSGGDNSIAIGQTETITLKARNTGRNPWYNHGGNPIRLATWEPADRYSTLFKTSRLATLTESVVNVGEVGTFTFNVTPGTEGQYVEGLNLVSENVMFMPWTGLRPTINVTSPYNWTVQNVIYENGTGVMDLATKQLVTVIAKNTGSTTWSKTSGPEIKLATWEPDRQSAVSSTWLSKTRVTYMNESSVAPGQTAGFQFYVTIPPKAGNYYERLNLVAEGQKWFNDQGLTLYLHGKSYAWQSLWHSHSTGTANIPRNTDFSVTLKVKNVGESTWNNSSPFPLRVGTVEPLNRSSAFYTSSWVNSTRPATLIENTVAPGSEGTFVIPMRTPSTIGQYNERFSLLAEGLLWLNDPNFSIYINVL